MKPATSDPWLVGLRRSTVAAAVTLTLLTLTLTPTSVTGLWEPVAMSIPFPDSASDARVERSPSKDATIKRSQPSFNGNEDDMDAQYSIQAQQQSYEDKLQRGMDQFPTFPTHPKFPTKPLAPLPSLAPKDQSPHEKVQHKFLTLQEISSGKTDTSLDFDALNNKREIPVKRFKFPSTNQPLQDGDIFQKKGEPSTPEPPQHRKTSPRRTSPHSSTHTTYIPAPTPSPAPVIEEKDTATTLEKDKDDLASLSMPMTANTVGEEDEIVPTTRGPLPLLIIKNATVKCDPRDYVQRGYCQKYFTCNRKLRVEIKRSCSEGLFWNPNHNSIHGGVCDYLRNIENETLLEYMKDSSCSLDVVYFRSDGDCSGDYYYHHPTRTGGLEVKESCPKGLVWSAVNESCELCHLAKKEDGSPCCSPPAKGGDDYW